MKSAAKAISAVEQGLQTTPISLANSPPTTAPLDERMAYHNVPGVSIAVINRGEIEWAKGYGLANVESGSLVTVDTRFSAASISKPVTALAILRLVQQGVFELDTDINTYLQTWRVPDNQFTTSSKVTLRYILSHTAGLDAGFYEGYGPDEPMPTLIQLLNGEPPSNSQPVKVITVPGTRYAYSGAGYWILQQLIIDTLEIPFADAMQDLVLKPLGMEHSAFGHPNGDAATAHDQNGAVHFDRWTRHPGQADGGLWTTPADLARFACAITHAYQGAGNEILQQELAQEMLTPQAGFHGLGPFIIGEGDGLLFDHGGSGEGFLCQMSAIPNAGRGQGAVFMTNGANGWPLIQEMQRTLAVVYEWPHHQPISKTKITLDSNSLSAYDGDYVIDASPLMIDQFVEYTGQWQVRDGRPICYSVQVEDDHLLVRFPNGEEVIFYAEADGTFFALTNPTILQFQPMSSAVGALLDVIVSADLKLTAQRRQPISSQT